MIRGTLLFEGERLDIEVPSETSFLDLSQTLEGLLTELGFHLDEKLDEELRNQYFELKPDEILEDYTLSDGFVLDLQAERITKWERMNG
jgi:hypothetical protein